MSAKNRAFLSLGSNSPADRKEILKHGISRISFSSTILHVSDVYETGGRFEKRDPYLNVCIEIETDMTSRELMSFLKEVENQMSQEQGDPNNTTLDCDFISYNNEVVRTPQLTLPHPEAHRRAFVMIPLAQIKPDWVHPILKKTAEELAQGVYWRGWGTFYADGKTLLDF